mmetsp:Transcript_63372/g.145771  ORF Transcript_63372/g.145771 Transcript_63372/m.145771 type:complete len:299 (+) Transcript_63372:1445-2341(+)
MRPRSERGRSGRRSRRRRSGSRRWLMPSHSSRLSAKRCADAWRSGPLQRGRRSWRTLWSPRSPSLPRRVPVMLRPSEGPAAATTTGAPGPRPNGPRPPSPVSWKPRADRDEERTRPRPAARRPAGRPSGTKRGRWSARRRTIWGPLGGLLAGIPRKGLTQGRTPRLLWPARRPCGFVSSGQPSRLRKHASPRQTRPAGKLTAFAQCCFACWMTCLGVLVCVGTSSVSSLASPPTCKMPFPRRSSQEPTWPRTPRPAPQRATKSAPATLAAPGPKPGTPARGPRQTPGSPGPKLAAPRL